MDARIGKWFGLKGVIRRRAGGRKGGRNEQLEDIK